MSRWIDADAVKEALKQNTPRYMWGEVLATVNVQPSIDLVRCAECIHSDWYKGINGEWRCYCTQHGSSGHKADDFCSYGERKESE